MEFYRVLILALWIVKAVSAEENRINSTDGVSSNTNIVTIDLRQCFCSGIETCDLTVIKSSLKEANCANGEHLCCPMIKSVPDSNSEENSSEDIDSKPTTNSNVRIYPIYAVSAAKNSDQLTSLKSKTKKSCTCKNRGTCPHKYIDYGFGFHCSYSQVRCCVPEDENNGVVESKKAAIDPKTKPEAGSSLISPNLEMTEEKKDAETIKVNETNENVSEGIPSGSTVPLGDLQETSPMESMEQIEEEMTIRTDSKPGDESSEAGELLITEVTNWEENDSYDKEFDCLCLSMEKCMAFTNYDANSIERRRDTMCPADLIQCCGKGIAEEITKKKDDTESLDETSVKQGFPPYQQPIPLPTANLPTMNGTEYEDTSAVKEATLPPPVLPTQYHSYEPVSYNRGNLYTPNSYQAHLSGPQPYQKGMYETNGQNIRPWVNLASPSSYSKYNPNPGHVNNNNMYHQGYPRGPYPDTGSGRSSKPGGLLDTLTQLLG